MNESDYFIDISHIITPAMQDEYYRLYTSSVKTSEFRFVRTDVHDAEIINNVPFRDLCEAVFFSVTGPEGVHPHKDSFYSSYLRQAIAIVPIYPYANNFENYRPTVYHTDEGLISAPVGTPILMNTDVMHSIPANDNITHRVALQFAFYSNIPYSEIRDQLYQNA